MTSQRVAVLGGGRSSEHEVSLVSAASVAEGLRAAGHEVRMIEIDRAGVWRCDGEEVALRAGRGMELRAGRGTDEIDVVFPVLHGPFGEDGTVQGLIECLGLPYVGAGVLASALCMDKVVFKDLMAQAGIPQVAYRAARIERFRADPASCLDELGALGLPVFVKPARLGSSVGIVRVAAEPELAPAVETAFAHDPLVIVEAAAGGIEVECSVLGNAEPIASEPGEIVLTAADGGWYDYEAKYTPGGMELIVPARISPAARARVRELAVETFVRSGCSGLARVDFFVDGDAVLVNELNTIPGFTPTSVFGALFGASGIPYPELLGRLVSLALERHEAASLHRY
jgi:D-alanine-D-alanine ligase